MNTIRISYISQAWRIIAKKQIEAINCRNLNIYIRKTTAMSNANIKVLKWPALDNIERIVNCINRDIALKKEYNI